MKNFMFSVACGCAVGGLVLSIANLFGDLAPKIIDWWERRKEKKENDDA